MARLRIRDPACCRRDHRRRMRWVHGDERARIRRAARERRRPGASSAPSEPAAGEPKDGGTLVVAIPGDIKRTDPALIDDSNTSYVMQNVMEGLVTLKPGTTGELEPGLAESWELSADGLTYTFKIREGVKFHDGTAVDAAAIKYNYDRWLNFPTELQDYSYYAGAVFGGYGDGSNIAATDAPDPTTFTVTLKSPVSSFLLSQTLDAVHDQQPDGPRGRRGGQHRHRRDPDPVRPGRRGLDGRHRAVQVRQLDARRQRQDRQEPRLLERRQAAHLDEVIFKPVAEEAQRLNGLSTGELDLVQTVAPIDVATIAAEPRAGGHRPRRVVQPVPRGPEPELQAHRRTRRSARPSPTRSTSRR